MASRPDPRMACADLGERAALCASAACLAHCLILPGLLLLLPSLSALLLIPESFHLWMLGLAVPCAMLALLLGRQRHGSIVPLITGAFGLLCLATGALLLGESIWETPMTVIGSVTLALAHGVNWRLRHSACEECA